MSENTILKIGTILNRKYKVEKYLGGGAFGEVYRVKNTFLKKRFAIKVFKVALDVKGNESTVQELLDEAVLLAKFDHRNIVKVHDADSFIGDDGQEHVFFVMDFVPGGDFYGMSAMVPASRLIAVMKGKSGKQLRREYGRVITDGCGKSLACRNICPAGIDIEGLMARSNATVLWGWIFGARDK